MEHPYYGSSISPSPTFDKLSSSLPKRPTGLQGASVCLSDLPSTLNLTSCRAHSVRGRTKCGVEDRTVSETKGMNRMVHAKGGEVAVVARYLYPGNRPMGAEAG